jgi:NAD(P)-dependent dehydrogenase (short-subunit alcohol dehydrogenase family)
VSENARVALVTGVTRGIGREVARQLAGKGARARIRGSSTGGWSPGYRLPDGKVVPF